MKTKRLKQARKIVGFYKSYFDICPPFSILIDGTFCKAALQFKINIREQLPKYLESELKLCTTLCAKAECEDLGPLLYGPFKVLQQFDLESCGHHSPLTAAKCFQSVMKKKKSIFVATQDQDLQEIARNRKGTPLLYITHNAIILDNPSNKSRHSAERNVANKISLSHHEQEQLNRLKRTVFGHDELKKRKRKKKKGVNPLSCKKKKTKPKEPILKNGVQKRKRKKKIKIAPHIIEHLKSSS
ncbi:rRNA-processing protein UTP23 homolog [Lingula anatina]|uniref:rRNA-processing protein UTP23 homolog n=1 Tax=Lingula anatina TaxID=7574 RepID=A0A1S3J5A9_LINAN|nr:rRNA-processing protein UTP23 homolog [Lingula anatina]|eukprot:XP_013405029.1 rRNA-processing protein UTP23 homolog [Lingula anatina]